MVTVTTVWSEFDFLENIPEDERRPIALKKAHKAKKIFSLDVGSALKLIDELKQSHAWLLLGCASFEDMLTELIQITPQALQEFEEGYQILKGRGVSGPIKSSEAIAALDVRDQMEQKGKGAPERNKNASKTNDNIVHNCLDRQSPVGNSQQAGLRRLRKDAPDLHQQVLNGDLSVHSACVKAGFRSPTLTIPIDPERAAKAILKRFDAGEVRHLIDLLQAGG